MLKNVVIVGGGFAGTRVAQLLERTLPVGWAVTLVSRENFITFSPLLPEVVGASILPGHVVAPHRQMIRRGNVCMADVIDIDTTAKIVQYLGEGSGSLQYDHLVLTCGSNANLDIVKGMALYALPLKTLGDALFLRNRIIARLEQAELQPDVHHRRWLTRFVVVGGGFSGVETAGELADFLEASLRYYRHINRDDIEIVLVHNGERLLPEMSANLGEFTLQSMRHRGVDVRLNTRVVGVTDLGVELDNGESLAAGTTVCTIGTQSNALLENIPAPKSHGRLQLNPDLSVQGVDCHWAAGDCAAVINEIDGALCPPTAQFAHAQAATLGANIVSHITGRPTRAFNYRPRGQLSSVGHTKAVAEIYGWKITGFMAWLLWRWVYLLRIPTFARKSRLFLEWSWAMFFPPDIAHFAYRRSARHTNRETHSEPMQPPAMPD